MSWMCVTCHRVSLYHHLLTSCHDCVSGCHCVLRCTACQIITMCWLLVTVCQGIFVMSDVGVIHIPVAGLLYWPLSLLMSDEFILLQEGGLYLALNRLDCLSACLSFCQSHSLFFFFFLSTCAFHVTWCYCLYLLVSLIYIFSSLIILT